MSGGNHWGGIVATRGGISFAGGNSSVRICDHCLCSASGFLAVVRVCSTTLSMWWILWDILPSIWLRFGHNRTDDGGSCGRLV